MLNCVPSNCRCLITLRYTIQCRSNEVIATLRLEISSNCTCSFNSSRCRECCCIIKCDTIRCSPVNKLITDFRNRDKRSCFVVILINSSCSAINSSRTHISVIDSNIYCKESGFVSRYCNRIIRHGQIAICINWNNGCRCSGLVSFQREIITDYWCDRNIQSTLLCNVCSGSNRITALSYDNRSIFRVSDGYSRSNRFFIKLNNLISAAKVTEFILSRGIIVSKHFPTTCDCYCVIFISYGVCLCFINKFYTIAITIVLHIFAIIITSINQQGITSGHRSDCNRCRSFWHSYLSRRNGGCNIAIFGIHTIPYTSCRCIWFINDKILTAPIRLR